MVILRTKMRYCTKCNLVIFITLQIWSPQNFAQSNPPKTEVLSSTVKFKFIKNSKLFGTLNDINPGASKVKVLFIIKRAGRTLFRVKIGFEVFWACFAMNTIRSNKPYLWYMHRLLPLPCCFTKEKDDL